MSGGALQNLPGVSAPFVDPATGIVTPAWYRFLVALFQNTGGGSGQFPISGDVTGSTAATVVKETHLTAPLPIAQGGTSAASAAAARTALGLGTISTQNANALNATLGASLLSSSSTFDIGAAAAGIAGIYFGTNTVKFDDFEKGTFSPTIFGSGTAGTPVYTDQTGSYAKFADAVIAWGNVAISAKTLIAGNIGIGALPFVSGSSPALFASCIAAFTGVTFTAGYTQLGLQVQAGTSTAILKQSGTAATAAVIADAAIAATTILNFLAIYRTD